MKFKLILFSETTLMPTTVETVVTEMTVAATTAAWPAVATEVAFTDLVIFSAYPFLCDALKVFSFTESFLVCEELKEGTSLFSFWKKDSFFGVWENSWTRLDESSFTGLNELNSSSLMITNYPTPFVENNHTHQKESRQSCPFGSFRFHYFFACTFARAKW